MPASAAAVLTSALLGLSLGGQELRSEPPEARFGEEISVALHTLVVRVVDSAGNPILGLVPEDFRVTVKRREIPVAAVDWVSSSEQLEPVEVEEIPAITGVDAPSEANPAPEGKLVVVFVQADLNPTRISGQLRLRPYSEDFLATLHPADRVAVVSFDSHLKLWLDWTPDREAVHQTIDRAMLFGGRGLEGWDGALSSPASPASLARHFDFAAAKDAASPERALELTARALAPFPGEKVIVYLGWGLGRFGADGVKMTPAFAPAVRALRAAPASVFVLDVTSADYHSLEVGLEAVAEATGGTYAKTFVFPGLATKALARTLAGHYVLTLDRDQLPEGDGELRIELRDKRGIVLARPVWLRSGAGG
jgi:VWFA-related protein